MGVGGNCGMDNRCANKKIDLGQHKQSGASKDSKRQAARWGREAFSETLERKDYKKRGIKKIGGLQGKTSRRRPCWGKKSNG